MTLDDGQTNASDLYGTFIALMVLSSATVILRLVARTLSTVHFSWDDYLTVLGWAFVTTTSAIFTSEISLGLGKNVHEISNPVSDFLHRNFVGEVLIHPSLATTKFVVLCFYGRIFSASNFKKALWLVGIINSLWLLGTGIPILFQCIPMKKIWLKNAVHYGHCLDFSAYLLGQSISNSLIDVILLGLPLVFLWKLQMTSTQKWAVGAVFGIGIFELAVSIVRLVVFVNIQYDNITVDFVDPALWSVVEINVGLMCASLMACGPILKFLHKKAISTYGTARIHTLNESGANRHAKRPNWAGSTSQDREELTVLNQMNGRSSRFKHDAVAECSSFKDPEADPAALSLDEIYMTHDVHVTESPQCK